MSAQFRFSLFIVSAFGIGAGSAVAQDALIDALRKCAAVAENRSRLDCFDALTATQARATAVPTRANTAVSDDSRDFGLEVETVRRLHAQAGMNDAPKATRVMAHVAAVHEAPYGRHEFTLDNGQVWQQSESEMTASLKMGDAVTITRGALGSFWIQAGSKVAIRAKRIR